MAGQLKVIDDTISCNDLGCQYQFTGSITSADVAAFQSIKRANDEQGLQLWITSPGGDVGAAIQIANLVHDLQISTVVGNRLPGFTGEQNCLSSCVIVFAAGVDRSPGWRGSGQDPDTQLGIHRVYSTDTSISPQQSRAAFERYGTEVRALFRESGVSESLWDEMQRVAPEKMRYLKQSEAISLGLKGMDPAYADFFDSRLAKKNGMTKASYLEAKAHVRSFCTQIPLHSMCEMNLTRHPIDMLPPPTPSPDASNRNLVDDAINAIPRLRYWRKYEPQTFAKCVAVDSRLMALPSSKGLSLVQRFELDSQIVGGEAIMPTR